MGSVDTWVGYWGRLRPARTVAVPVDSGDDQDLIPPDCVGITLAAAAEPTGIAATLGALHAGAASPSPPLLSARRSCGSGRPALLFRDRTITWAEFEDRVIKQQLRSLGSEP